MYAYCLFCQTTRCASVARTLEKLGATRAFSPRLIQHARVLGKTVQVQRDLLPGYVFAYGEEPLPAELLSRPVDGLIRRLGDADRLYQLEGADLAFALKLYAQDGMIGVVRLFREGEAVRIQDPLFASMQGKVLRVDGRKQRAQIEFTFDHTTHRLWVACERLEKAAPPPTVP